MLLAACVASLNLANFKLETPLDSGNTRDADWQSILRFLPAGYQTANGRPTDAVYAASKVLQRLNILRLVTQYEVMDNGDKRAVPAIKWLNKDWFVKIRAVKYSRIAGVVAYTRGKIADRFKRWREKNPGYQDHIIADAAYQQSINDKADEDATLALLASNADRNKIDEYAHLRTMFPDSVIRKTHPHLLT